MTEGFREYKKAETTWAAKLPRDATIPTPEGTVEASAGDYLALDSQGRPYPIEAEEFESIYEPVDEDHSASGVSEDDVYRCHECGGVLGHEWRVAQDAAEAAGTHLADCPHCDENPLPPVGASPETDDEVEDTEDETEDVVVCEECGDEFDSERGRKIHHARVHDDEDEVWCAICGFGPTSASGFNGHARSHEGDVPTLDHEPSEDELVVGDEDDEETYVCEDCDKEYDNEGHLNSHRVREHVNPDDVTLPRVITEADLATVAEVEDDVEGVAENLEVDEERARKLLGQYEFMDAVQEVTPSAE